MTPTPPRHLLPLFGLVLLLCGLSAQGAESRYTTDARSLALGGSLSALPHYHMTGANPALLSQLDDRTDLLLKFGSYGRGAGYRQNYNDRLATLQESWTDYLATPNAQNQTALEQAALNFGQSEYRESQRAVGAIALPHLPIALDAHVAILHQEQFLGSKQGANNFSDPANPELHAVGSYRALTTLEIATAFSGVVYEDEALGRKLSVGLRPKLLSHRSRGYQIAAQDIVGTPFHDAKTGEFNLDLGLVYRFQHDRFAGLMISNLKGQSLPYITTDQEYQQQADARLGFAQHRGAWLLSAELELLPDEDLWGNTSRRLRTGVEVAAMHAVQLRLGTMQDLTRHQPSSVTAGLGINTRLLLLDLYLQHDSQQRSAGLGIGLKL